MCVFLIKKKKLFVFFLVVGMYTITRCNWASSVVIQFHLRAYIVSVKNVDMSALDADLGSHNF